MVSIKFFDACADVIRDIVQSVTVSAAVKGLPDLELS
jgi:hypothetical protein